MIKYPDYDRSILSVASSVLKHFGVKDCPHKSLGEFDKILDKNYKNIIVLLFDGLGTDALENHLQKDSFLRRHLVCPIFSVFPPTTVAATTAIQTGCSPIEHGWLGWDLYFKEMDDNIAVFRNAFQRTGEKAADYHIASKYIPFKSVFTRIEEADKKAKAYYLSPFSSPAVDKLEVIQEAVIKLSKEQGKKYIYVYHPQPDHDMHINGVTAPCVGQKIKEINDMVEVLCKGLKDSVVIVTADHGLIDSKVAFLEEYPKIWNMLLRPASIEPRALSLFVKEPYKDSFKREFENTFKDKYILLTKQEVYDLKLFGNGEPHPRTDGFIGDFLAIGVSDLTLFNYREDDPFIGVHAGLDEREMTVPFIAVEKR